MAHLRTVCLLLLFALFLQCKTQEQEDPEIEIPVVKRGDVHVLFVGNSLTYVNSLPSIVSEIAAMDGVNLTNSTMASPNYALEDHLMEGTIVDALQHERFDFLIGQQGPSALPESQKMLRHAAVTIAKECRKTNTTFGLYMVWPSLARSFDHNGCIASYTKAAKASDALLCPAGLAWKLAWKKDSELPLYGGDNFHPSIHGSVLAAMVIYATIKEKKDLDFIDGSRWAEISKAQLDIMKAAAIESVTDR